MHIYPIEKNIQVHCQLIIPGTILHRLSWNVAQTDTLVDDSSDESSQYDFGHLAFLLRSCSSLQQGMFIHHQILKESIEGTSPIPSLLVLMYCNCEAIHEAQTCVASFPQFPCNVFTWNFILKACGQLGFFYKSLEVYFLMVKQGIVPNKVTLLHLLNACACRPTYLDVLQLHEISVVNGYDSDKVVGTALLKLYSKVAGLKEVQKVFNQILEKDVVTWTSCISIYGHFGQQRMAIQLFKQMQDECIAPDKVTFIAAVGACNGHLALSEGRCIHTFIVERGFANDVVVCTTLINMYGKCGSATDAIKTFCQISQRNVVTWNALIGVYSEQGTRCDIIQHIRQMRTEGFLPNRETYINILSVCSNHEILSMGVEIHACIRSIGLDLDIALGNVLINMYGKCNAIANAQRTFDHMAKLNVISWTAMITVHVQDEKFWEAISLFEKMQMADVEPNEVTFVTLLASCTDNASPVEGRCLHSCIVEKYLEGNNAIKDSLLNMYASLGNIEDAEWIFSKMHVRDVISWTAMISGLAEHVNINSALKLYFQMQKDGKQPNEVSFVNILTSCASQAALIEGMQLHMCVVENGLDSNIDIGNSLINMYGKSGRLRDAYGSFNSMPARDLVSWNTLLTVFSQHGLGMEVLGLFCNMRLTEYFPDNVTFSCVIAACSHSGHLNEAWQLCQLVEQDQLVSLSINHCICMVDLLGRAGSFYEALLLISLMPLQPNVLLYMSILGACQCHVDVRLAEFTAKLLIELDAENSAPYVVLSNIYAVMNDFHILIT